MNASLCVSFLSTARHFGGDNGVPVEAALDPRRSATPRVTASHGVPLMSRFPPLDSPLLAEHIPPFRGPLAVKVATSAEGRGWRVERNHPLSRRTPLKRPSREIEGEQV